MIFEDKPRERSPDAVAEHLRRWFQRRRDQREGWWRRWPGWPGRHCSPPETQCHQNKVDWNWKERHPCLNIILPRVAGTVDCIVRWHVLCCRKSFEFETAEWDRGRNFLFTGAALSYSCNPGSGGILIRFWTRFQNPEQFMLSGGSSSFATSVKSTAQIANAVL